MPVTFFHQMTLLYLGLEFILEIHSEFFKLRVYFCIEWVTYDVRNGFCMANAPYHWATTCIENLYIDQRSHPLCIKSEIRKEKYIKIAYCSVINIYTGCFENVTYVTPPMHEND